MHQLTIISDLDTKYQVNPPCHPWGIVADGWTDGRTDRQHAILYSPPCASAAGNKNDLTNVVMVVPFHPTNPKFKKTTSQIWEKYEKHLEGLMNKPIIPFTRPKNLRDILVRATYGAPATTSPTQTKYIINRSIRSYDKNQMKAKILHVLFKCSCGQELHEFN